MYVVDRIQLHLLKAMMHFCFLLQNLYMVLFQNTCQMIQQRKSQKVKEFVQWI